MRKFLILCLSLSYLLLLSSVFITPPTPVDAASTGWLSGYYARRSHTVNQTVGAGTNYQIKLFVHYGTGNTTTDHIYLNSRTWVQTDFDDIRFTTDNGYTSLYYWKQQYIASDYAIFWIKLTADLTTSNVTFYIYYGNMAVSDESDPTNTFLFFDTFANLNVWHVYSGIWTVNNSLLSHVNSTTAAFIKTQFYGGTNYAVNARVRINDAFATTSRDGLLVRMQDANSFYGHHLTQAADIISLQEKRIVGAYSADTSNQTVLAEVDNWQCLGIQCVGTNITTYLNNTKITSKIWNELASGAIGLTSFQNSIDVDWICVRKLVLTEPIHATWTSEEVFVASYKSWDFATSVDYTYNTTENNITGGLAFLNQYTATNATHTYNLTFDTGSDYTYNSTTITVASGNASLTPINASIVPDALYHLNGVAGLALLDSSANTYDGTLVNMETTDWITGKLNNALEFGGTDEYVTVTSAACGNYDYTDAFTLETWIYPTSANRLVLGKYNATSGIGYYLSYEGNKFVFRLASSATLYNQISTTTSHTVNAWYHVIATHDGTDRAAGMNIYVNGVTTKAVNRDTRAGTIINNVHFNIGSVSEGLGGTFFVGKIDETAIYPYNVSLTEITFRYNVGIGTETLPSSGLIVYTTSNPTIAPTVSFNSVEPIALLKFWEVGFKPALTDIRYVLSFNQGTSWYYWTGATWAVSTSYAQTNNATIINATINTFPLVDSHLTFKTYLHTSNVTVTPQLDSVTIVYELTTNLTHYENASAIFTSTPFNFTVPINAFIETSIIYPLSAIYYQLSYDNGTTYKYWSGASWDTVIAFNITYANTADVVNLYIHELANCGTFTVRIYLVSEDGVNSPWLDNLFVAEENLLVTTSVTTLTSTIITSTVVSNITTTSSITTTDTSRIVVIDNATNGEMLLTGIFGGALVLGAVVFAHYSTKNDQL